jgi:hypothetical protein
VFTVGKLLSKDGMGTDWYEGATVQADRVLDDFLLALNPAAADPQLTFKWLHQLSTGPGGITYISPKMCPTVRTCENRRPASTCPNTYWSCADGTMVYGYRNYHCKPATCTETSCWCCNVNVPSTCATTCSAANKNNCPR